MRSARPLEVLERVPSCFGRVNRLSWPMEGVRWSGHCRRADCEQHPFTHPFNAQESRWTAPTRYQRCNGTRPLSPRKATDPWPLPHRIWGPRGVLWRLPTATIAKSATRAASSPALHRRRLTRRTAQPHWGSELEMLSKKRVCSSPTLGALLCPRPLLKTSSDRHPMPHRRPCPSRQASVRQPSSGSTRGSSCARCMARIRASSLQSRQATGHSRDRRQTGQESVTRSARPSDRVGRMWVDGPHLQLLLRASTLANGVDLDASSGMGAGSMCPVHVKPHGRRGERWERANVSQYMYTIHVLTRPV